MDRVRLKVVGASPERPATRACRLLAEARKAAREHLRESEVAMAAVQVLAIEVAEGGDAYPPGVRDLCQRLAQDSEARMQTLAAITQRVA